MIDCNELEHDVTQKPVPTFWHHARRSGWRGGSRSVGRAGVGFGASALRFARANRGVALLEFALVAPFLIALLFGSFELTRFINTTRQISNLSNSVAQLFAQSTSGTISDTDLHFAIDSTMVTFPNVLGDAHNQGIYWWQDIYVAMSSVIVLADGSGLHVQLYL